MKPFITLLHKSTILILLFHHLIASNRLVFTSELRNSRHLGNETDYTALLAIKSRLVDHPSGVLSSWNHSLDHCHWDGVTCDRVYNRVIVLDLNSRGLIGTISPFIGNLSFLTEIALYNNSLVGQIPPELGRLFRLHTLRLNNNTLEGQFPANLSTCINLETLNVGVNNLEGKLPSELRQLSKLKHLKLPMNRFTGPLFEVISNLTSIETISALNNAFTGNIVESIGKMRNLSTLAVGGNHISGTIPISILNCSMLEAIDLGSNNLHGEIPPNIGLRLPRLVWFRLFTNNFSGPFPSSILNLTNLEYLGLHSNNFVGNVPNDLGKFHNLWFIALGFNHFTGDISFIRSLLNCTKLEWIVASGNKFTGTLPHSITNFSSHFQYLSLKYNQITGEIPVGITNLINLQTLELNGNHLTGHIARDLGKLRSIQTIDISSNRLTGIIPDNFGNLSFLSEVNLDDNRFEGSIPPSLGRCQSLLHLNLSVNRLNGTLEELFKGPAKFVSVDLSKNRLEGSIPVEISKQVSLVEFSVSRNRLSGTIPYGLGKCLGLKMLDVHGNFLEGYIPSSFASLGSLQIVDLSRNNFSGTVPSYFSKFPLHLLNLSYNNFEGEIPTTGVFTNLSAIALDGNINLCGGISALHLQRCITPHKETEKRKLSRALKLTIPILCVLVGVLIIMTCLYFTRCRKKKASTSTSFSREPFIKVSYQMLAKATNGFSYENLVGVGSFGSVFKGTLNGRTICVKVLNLQNRGASKSFIAECRALQNVRHRNLVGIITVCSSIDFQKNDFKALVYEFMANGSLDEWLHGQEEKKLTLAQRVDIAIDVAHALKYLHHDCETPIVHRDLKPSNILLDDEMVAHVGDFGLAKFLDKTRFSNQSSSIGILGTIGYVAPEYGLGSESSPEGDIYSYGTLLLELMTGKRPTNSIFNEDFNLQTYAEASLPDKVLQIVDPVLVQEQVECIVCMMSVGIECSKHVPQDRMKINDAITKLQAARNNLGNVR